MAKQESFNQNKLESLKKETESLEKRLSASSSAFSSGVSPTKSDIDIEAKLQKARQNIEQMKSQRLKERWYGPTTTDDTDAPPEKEGLISRGLHALSAPLYAIAGGAEWAVGKGSKQGLIENISANIKEKEAFGSLLSKIGAPKMVSAPIGFALDIALDPVNWLTAGSAALIPRVASGFVKGTMKGGVKTGLEAVKAGAISSIGGKTRAIMPWVAPVKTIGKIGSKIGDESLIGKPLVSFVKKYGELTERIGKKAITEAEKYDVLMDRNIYDQLGKGIMGISDLSKGKTLGAKFEEAIRNIPDLKLGKIKISGDDIVDFFKYSPAEHAKVSHLADRVNQLAESKGILFVDPERIKAGETIFESIDDALKAGNIAKIKDVAKKQAKKIIDSGVESAQDFVMVENNLENAKKMLEISEESYNLKHLVKAYEKMPLHGETGVKWYDNWMRKQKVKTVGGFLEKTKISEITKKMGIFNKVKDWTPLKKIVDANDEFVKIFKWAKVPANPSSHMNALAGNITFAALGGMPVTDPRLLKAIKDNYQFLRGKKGLDFLRETMFNDTNTWFNLLQNDPIFFQSIFGFAPESIIGKIPVGAKIPIKDIFKKLSPDLNIEDVVSEIKSKIDDITRNLDDAISEAKKNPTIEGIIKAREKVIKEKPLPSGKETIQNLMERSKNVRLSELPSGWAATELAGGKYLGGIEKWAARGREGNPAKWLADKIVNSMPKHYEYIDQAYKLGNSQYLTNIGLQEKNLLKLSRYVKIDKSDLLDPVIEGGKKLYRLTPQKAAEASAEIFMNYAAMPQYVKILRSLPLLGSPFFSFQAAMLAKGGKTLVSDPAIFNKISFLLNEISGARTPLEKKALEEKYNQYLNSPNVVRLSRNWNINVENLIPFLSMNVLNPSERKYQETLPGVAANIIDSSPLFKHPIGQILLDYIILPSILSEAERPQGAFGQPLYPIDATLGEKAFYAGRQLAETVVPGVAAYAGVIQPQLKGMGVPDEAIKFYPSYGWRQIAEATRGKSTIGALTKEDKTQRTLRSLAARSGLPLYPLKTEYISGKK